MKEFEQWQGFSGRKWKEGVDVRDFIQNNYKPYDGDEKSERGGLLCKRRSGKAREGKRGAHLF